MLKKISAVFAAIVIVITAFAGCSVTQQSTATDGKKLSIVCTVFPLYDFTMNILGDIADEADVTMLLDTGVDLHSYQATAEDILTIASADMFVYVGGNSDKWVNEITVDLSSVKMIDGMDIVKSNLIEEETALEEDEDEEESGGTVYDEHIWMSLRNSDLICSAICDTLCEIDPEDADTFRANYTAYSQKLTDLDAQYTEVTANAAHKTLVFADRFPFTYLFNDYGLGHVAAFAGCSTESNASFNTVMRLAEALNGNDLNNILITETGNNDIADTVISTSGRENVEILTLNAMQSVKSGDIGTITYIDAMTDNLQVLKEALA